MEKTLQYTDATGAVITVGIVDHIYLSDIDPSDNSTVKLEDTNGNTNEYELCNDGGPHMRPKLPR